MGKTNTEEERSFFDAIANCKIETVQELVQANPDLLDSYDYRSFGATPVTKVCFGGAKSMLTTLIELGADLDRKSDWSMGPWSPLHCAAFNRSHEVSSLLLEHGATMDVHAAAGLGRADDVARLLDDSPERVNEPGGDGCQPLHFADSPDVAQLLLDRGADIEARCIDHYSTPVQYLACKRPEVARFLFSKGAQADIFSAVMANDSRTVERLIDNDRKVLNARINREYFPHGPEHEVDNIMTFSVGGEATPMHAAAKGNHPEMVSLLIRSGQSPNVRGGYDDATPLHIAAWDDHAEVAQTLVEGGADVNARSGSIHNNTPAGWAIVAGSANVFDVLMNTGAEILDYFLADALTAVDGGFLKYKVVSEDNYKRILERLNVCR